MRISHIYENIIFFSICVALWIFFSDSPYKTDYEKIILKLFLSSQFCAANQKKISIKHHRTKKIFYSRLYEKCASFVMKSKFRGFSEFSWEICFWKLKRHFFLGNSMCSIQPCTKNSKINSAEVLHCAHLIF